MIKEDTVFILGAGASWHYGYPTGETLVRKVVQKLRNLAESCRVSSEIGKADYDEAKPQFITENFCDANAATGSREEQRKEPWLKAAESCEKLAKRIEVVDPPVIDYYIGQQSEASRVLCKLAIAWALLDCERESEKASGNINRKEQLELSPEEADRNRAKRLGLSQYADKWHRFILYQLSVGCEKSSDIHHNKVRFITFNYDVSLEHYLDRGLRSNNLFTTKDIESFLGNDRFIHVYGNIRENPLEKDTYGKLSPDMVNNYLESPANNNSKLERLKEFIKNADYVYQASKGIHTIANGNTGKSLSVDETKIELAKKEIAKAKSIYILGYGFDDNNNNLLNLREHCRIRTSLSAQTQRKIMFTNFGNINRVNKMASKIFSPSGSSEYFMESNILDLSSSGVGGLSDYFEKSTNDVYSALSCDFDFLNE
jgi:hypothetical protein